jgi:hypothetical protein
MQVWLVAIVYGLIGGSVWATLVSTISGWIYGGVATISFGLVRWHRLRTREAAEGSSHLAFDSDVGWNPDTGRFEVLPPSRRHYPGFWAGA